MKDPRVLLIGHSLKGGGAEGRFANLCQSLSFFRIDVATLKDDALPGHFVGDKKIISLAWKNKLSYPRIILSLRRIMMKEQYDAVMSFGLFPNLVALLATRCTFNKPKFIASEITRPWTALKSSGFIRSFLYKKMYKVIFHGADLVTANSIDGVAECVKYYGLNKRRVMRIPNLINKEIIEQKASLLTNVAVPQNEALFVISSRVEKMKRIDILFKAAAMLPKEINWSILVIGDGSELNSLITLAKEMGIANKIVFQGWVDNPFPFIKKATAYVLCSEYEGFSNSVLEAMFLGTPVITSFCSSDAREMCREGAALGFEVGDEATLSNHLLTVLSSSEVRRKLRKNAFLYSRNHETSIGIKYYEDVIMHALSVQR